LRDCLHHTPHTKQRNRQARIEAIGRVGGMNPAAPGSEWA
jgi:hypothetical protein